MSFRLFVFEKNALFFLFQEVSADRRCLFFRPYVAFFQHFAVRAGKSREKKAKSSGVWRKSRELFIESWEGVSEEWRSASVRRCALCPWGGSSCRRVPPKAMRARMFFPQPVTMMPALSCLPMWCYHTCDTQCVKEHTGQQCVQTMRIPSLQLSSKSKSVYLHPKSSFTVNKEMKRQVYIAIVVLAAIMLLAVPIHSASSPR